YVESDKNYLNLYCLDQAPVRIRSTVKEFGEAVGDFDWLIRCHRAYYVNLHQIESVSGNAQGLTLHLKKSDQTIPVSRAYIPTLKAHF
ncbi:MAG: LytTR family DNA-binding domain-containing protein, partial [Bacteroidota bacterium]